MGLCSSAQGVEESALAGEYQEKNMSLIKQIAGKMRAGVRAARDFKPSVEFLTIISSPSTPFYVYAETLHKEVLRVISAEFCFLHFVDEIREKILSLYFPSDQDSLANKQHYYSTRKATPVFWESNFGEGLVGTQKSLNIQDAVLHNMFKDGVDYPPGLSATNVLRSFCSQPVRYMGDDTRIIGSITVTNKDGSFVDAKGTSFSLRDVSQLRSICLQVSDSFYRQRIQAFEDRGDSHAKALLAHYDGDHQDIHGRRSMHHGGTVRESDTESLEETKSMASSKYVVEGDNDLSTVSPISRSQLRRLDVESGVNKSLEFKNTKRNSRNVASGKDLLLYHWPDEERFGQRGLPCSELGVPDNFRTIEFSALDFSPERLERFVLSIFRDTGIANHFSVGAGKLVRWTRAARASYRDNPFHNWYHGFSVLHFCYFELYSTDISSFLHPLDVFGLLIAALCHDSDHPAKTNGFLITVEDGLAIQYNDVSVLENHHAFIACELLRSPSTSLSLFLEKKDRRELRKIVITCILATDMAHHDKLCKKILARDKLRPFRSDRVTDRQTLLNLCVHSADLSAQTLPWATACKWEERISMEFSAQADAERSLGLNPAPFMCNLDDIKVRGKGQMSKLTEYLSLFFASQKLLQSLL